jgi:hypothetical protein
MSFSRREFMKLFGASVASLVLTSCRPRVEPTCYVAQPIDTATLTPHGHLRALWLRFSELAQTTTANYQNAEILMRQMSSDHRLLLDGLVTASELTAPVADLVQEAYGAALYHVWRSNAPMTCYEPMLVDYQPTSANVLVEQAAILGQAAGSIDPATLAKAQAAIEHDMAFYALNDADVQALYDRLTTEWQDTGVYNIPTFDNLDLELTADARTAAQFIVDILTGK